MDQLEFYHNGMFKEDLSEILAESWQRSRQMGVDPLNATFDVCSDEGYQRAKKNSYLLYMYCNRRLEDLASKMKDPGVGFAFFDPGGQLLRLYYRSPLFAAWAEQHGITKKTIWTERSIGTNAVPLGLMHRRPFLTQTKDHYCKLLSDAFVVFAPCFINGTGEDMGKEICWGGIAAFGPDSIKAYEYLLIAGTLIKEASLYASVRNGMASWDVKLPGALVADLTRNSKSIITLNESAYDILEIPKENLTGEKLDYLFDPLPKNAEFWDMIDQEMLVQNLPMTLSMKGRKKKFIVSTTYERQEYQGFSFVVINIKPNSRAIDTPAAKQLDNGAQFTFRDILGRSPTLLHTLAQAKHIANSESNVLIIGETGVGKDILAQAIHNSSTRREGPFVALNCAAIPRDLIASELFGYEYGAFSGSKKEGNKGKFELANTGTLFLDEIGDMPIDLQAVLLRVVEEKRFIKLGGAKCISTDVRIICATNSDIKQKIQKKLFREDLYYRISTISLKIPALRERKEDIPVLANAFVDAVCTRLNLPTKQLTPEAMSLLINLPWPGNVRELKNLIESVLQLHEEREIQAKYILDDLETRNWTFRNSHTPSQEAPAPSSVVEEPHIIFNHMKISRTYLMDALEKTDHNKSKTAQYLGISRKTLYKWMGLFGIQ